MPKVVVIPDIDNLVQRYTSGVSINQLSHDLGISRPAITTALERASIQPRTQSEAELVKWKSMPTATRHAQVKACHDAVRGKRRTMTDLETRALGRQQSCSQQSPAEREFIDIFQRRTNLAFPLSTTLIVHRQLELTMPCRCPKLNR